MDSAKKQLADRLKSANNILVTVSRDPSIDQLAACIGLTLVLNKLNKHSVAVFSGQAPSAIEFLKPDSTLEKTTDSLRDFIIALDKDKADKLRYKVEDNVVRIFITPYKTSITQEDLEFSQGDFNVDVVIALGVKQQQDVDEAITAHGRILHDATVASINLSPDGGLGTINWHDPGASSLSELVTDLTSLLGDKLLDKQIATALLTGIVAETNRFSNNRTSSEAMNASSVLMAAGADQQLVASKLEAPEPDQPPPPKPEDGEAGKPGDNTAADTSTLSISHEEAGKAEQPEDPQPPEPESPAPQLPTPQPPAGSNLQPGAKLLTEDSPTIGGTLNANTKPEGLDPVTDPLSMPQKEEGRLFSHQPVPGSMPPPPPVPQPPAMPPTPPQPAPSLPASPPPPPPAPEPPLPTIAPPSPPPSLPDSQQTLSQIEQSVHSPHVDPDKLDTARDEVNQALQNSVAPAPPPIKALNAQPLGGNLHDDAPEPAIQPASSPVLPFDNTPGPSDNPSPSDPADRPAGAPPVPPPLPSETVNQASKPDQSPPPAL